MKKRKVALVSEKKTCIDPEPGIVLTIETTERGLLSQSTTSVENQRDWAKICPLGDDDIAVNWLKGKKRQAQEILEKADLPTDSEGLLVFQIENKVEPLSKEAEAANLIDKINSLLRFQDKRAILTACQFASALMCFEIAGDMNSTHGLGEKMLSGPEKGREALSETAGTDALQAAILVRWNMAPELNRFELMGELARDKKFLTDHQLKESAKDKRFYKLERALRVVEKTRAG